MRLPPKCVCVCGTVSQGFGDVTGSDGDLDVGECQVRWEKWKDL